MGGFGNVHIHTHTNVENGALCKVSVSQTGPFFALHAETLQVSSKFSFYKAAFKISCRGEERIFLGGGKGAETPDTGLRECLASACKARRSGARTPCPENRSDHPRRLMDPHRASSSDVFLSQSLPSIPPSTLKQSPPPPGTFLIRNRVPGTVVAGGALEGRSARPW